MFLIQYQAGNPKATDHPDVFTPPLIFLEKNGCLFFCYAETPTRNLILQWRYKPQNPFPAITSYFRLHIELSLLHILLSILRLDCRGLRDTRLTYNLNHITAEHELSHASKSYYQYYKFNDMNVFGDRNL